MIGLHRSLRGMAGEALVAGNVGTIVPHGRVEAIQVPLRVSGPGAPTSRDTAVLDIEVTGVGRPFIEIKALGVDAADSMIEALSGIDPSSATRASEQVGGAAQRLSRQIEAAGHVSAHPVRVAVPDLPGQRTTSGRAADQRLPGWPGGRGRADLRA